MPTKPQKRSQTVVEKCKPRGRPFSGRDDPRNRTNGEARPISQPTPVEGEGLLAAMRHVLANDKAHDRTPEQKLARMLLKERTKFFDAVRVAGESPTGTSGHDWSEGGRS